MPSGPNRIPEGVIRRIFVSKWILLAPESILLDSERTLLVFLRMGKGSGDSV